jgi:hypothetical protein
MEHRHGIEPCGASLAVRGYKRRAPSVPEGKTATGKDWRGNLADQAIGRIEARLVLLLLSKIVIPVK